jgi:NAD(P)-dependent dehydrogenase (short-subunit alcohol dehydrogenase family)
MFEELEDTWFERIMTVNYFGTVNVVRAVLPYMKKLRAGRYDVWQWSQSTSSYFFGVESYL